MPANSILSKLKDAEQRFKEVAEAYGARKDSDQRRACDRLGRYRERREFHSPGNWERQFRELFASRLSAQTVDLGGPSRREKRLYADPAKAAAFEPRPHFNP